MENSELNALDGLFAMLQLLLTFLVVMTQTEQTRKSEIPSG